VTQGGSPEFKHQYSFKKKKEKKAVNKNKGVAMMGNTCSPSNQDTGAGRSLEPGV
jgi:hypothetical protein